MLTVSIIFIVVFVFAGVSYVLRPFPLNKKYLSLALVCLMGIMICAGFNIYKNSDTGKQALLEIKEKQHQTEIEKKEYESILDKLDNGKSINELSKDEQQIYQKYSEKHSNTNVGLVIVLSLVIVSVIEIFRKTN